jgi:Ser/Thr protein kinase RdoA (MazF antagonist)
VDLTAVVDAFGLGDLREAAVVARGQQGLVWRVDTRRGRFAVKQLLAPVGEQDVRADVALASVMVDRGVRTPRPLRTASGAVLVTIADVVFRGYTWVDLQEPRRDLDPDAVGRLMAVLHRDPLPADPTPGDFWYVDPVPDDDWLDASERLAAAGAPFAAEFAASVPRFLALQEVFRPAQQTQLCHRDVWADNVRLTDDGELCVIDWDNCGAADPGQELAMTLVDFCYRDDDRVARLYGAYRRAGGPGRLVDPGDFTMVLAQFGHFAVTAARRWLDATDASARGRAEAWFREGWEMPFGLPEIARMLRAVRRG